MKNLIGSNVLVTTSAWVVAPDGKEYRSVFGELKGVHKAEDVLGFTPSRNHTNWFLEVGSMFIAGCQGLYVIASDEVNLGTSEHWDTKDGKINVDQAPCKIYNANEAYVSGGTITVTVGEVEEEKPFTEIVPQGTEHKCRICKCFSPSGSKIYRTAPLNEENPFECQSCYDIANELPF